MKNSSDKSVIQIAVSPPHCSYREGEMSRKHYILLGKLQPCWGKLGTIELHHYCIDFHQTTRDCCSKGDWGWWGWNVLGVTCPFVGLQSHAHSVILCKDLLSEHRPSHWGRNEGAGGGKVRWTQSRRLKSLLTSPAWDSWIHRQGAALRNSEPRNSGLDFHIRLWTAGIKVSQCGRGARAQMVRQGFAGGTTPEEDLYQDSWKQTREQIHSYLVIKTEHGDWVDKSLKGLNSLG